MTSNCKIAVLVVETPKGDRHIVAHDACAVSIRTAALEAQASGAAKVDGATIPITGGFVVCSWREPCVTFRFRCTPQAPKQSRK